MHENFLLASRPLGVSVSGPCEMLIVNRSRKKGNEVDECTVCFFEPGTTMILKVRSHDAGSRSGDPLGPKLANDGGVIEILFSVLVFTRFSMSQQDLFLQL
jgi:hypothetical protein